MASFHQASHAARQHFRGAQTYMSASIVFPVTMAVNQFMNGSPVVGAFSTGLAVLTAAMVEKTILTNMALGGADTVPSPTGNGHTDGPSAAKHHLSRLKATAVMSFALSPSLGLTAAVSGDKISAVAAVASTLTAMAAFSQASKASSALANEDASRPGPPHQRSGPTAPPRFDKPNRPRLS
ncbi:MAG: hypothetical protein HOQ05_08235 [Corynebacteriales bacterium]|nr:hypothetical protein [Mycobacteriales bacterium]